MKLYGQEYTKSEIEKLVPDFRQVFGTRSYELSEGATRGTRIVDVNTGLLKYSIVIDRGMDISLASYKGMNITHLTENGEVNPAFYQSQGNEWARIFFGGMMTTCGLQYLGPPGYDGDEMLGLHGRHSSIPARYVRDESGWVGDEYRLFVVGQIDDTMQMGNKVRLKRQIESEAGKAVIKVSDYVENVGTRPVPFTILYHINFGFPVLNEGTKVLISGTEIVPFEEYSEKMKGTCFDITKPESGFLEENYLIPQNNNDKYSYAMVVNERLGNKIGVYIKASADTLPYLCYWKMLDERDYIIAIEPSNVMCENRSVLKTRGELPYLNPKESKQMTVEIGVVEGESELRQIEKLIKTC